MYAMSWGQRQFKRPATVERRLQLRMNEHTARPEVPLSCRSGWTVSLSDRIVFVTGRDRLEAEHEQARMRMT